MKSLRLGHLRLSAALVLALGLAGCSGGPLGGLIPGTTPEPQTPIGGGSALQNLAQFGTTTLPPVPEANLSDEVECPVASILPGGASLRIGGQTSDSVRSQVSITDVARECLPAAGGGVAVRLGTSGRVLVGPAGSAGAHFASMRIEVRRGDTVLSTRSVRVGAQVPGGQAGADWTHIENGIVIPASAFASRADLDIFVMLGNAQAEPRRRR